MEKEKISSHQFGHLILSVLIGYYIVLSLVQKDLKQDAWIGTLFVIVCGFFVVLLLFAWLKRFGTADWQDIFRGCYGRKLGNVIMFLYGLFFLFLCIFMVWFLAFFWSSLGMNNTPQIFYILSMILLIVFLTVSGVEVLARFSNIILIIVLAGVLVNFIFLIHEMDIENLLPVAQFEVGEFAKTTVLTAISQYGDLVVCLPFFMYLNNTEKAGRCIVGYSLFGGLLLTLITIRNILVLGSAKYIYTIPVIQALKLIDFGGIFTRVEILGVIYIMLICLVRCAVSFSSACISFQKVFNVNRVTVIAVPLAIIAAAASFDLFFSPEEIRLFCFNYYYYFGVFFAVILPVVTILLSFFRKSRAEE